MLQLQAHVVGHAEGAEAGRVAGAVVGVDIVLGESGVGQGALGAFGVNLGGAQVWNLPERMLEDAGDVGFSLNAHLASNDFSKMA